MRTLYDANLSLAWILFYRFSTLLEQRFPTNEYHFGANIRIITFENFRFRVRYETNSLEELEEQL